MSIPPDYCLRFFLNLFGLKNYWIPFSFSFYSLISGKNNSSKKSDKDFLLDLEVWQGSKAGDISVEDLLSNSAFVNRFSNVNINDINEYFEKKNKKKKSKKKVKKNYSIDLVNEVN